MLADADVVAGLEALFAQGGDHAHLGEALLEVGEGFFVFGVVAFEEELDAAAADAEGAVVLALDPVAALAGRSVDAVLGLELGRRRARPGWRRAAGRVASSARIRLRRSSRPSPVAEETDITPSTESPRRSVHSATAASTALGFEQVALREDDQLRQALQPGPVGLELRPHHLVVADRLAFQRHQLDQVDEHRAALDVGEELVPEPGPVAAPSISPGMSASTAWRSSPSIVPSSGERVVNG